MHVAPLVGGCLLLALGTYFPGTFVVIFRPVNGCFTIEEDAFLTLEEMRENEGCCKLTAM